ncbi:hypothetical protein KP509_20G024000 [Ceratopteris richardii]|uniref:CBM20 domain-containing protein n=1 Tax=Ceratopteris richardii TaxID=49495 RepID=A0A8T2SHM9_CERRI|nr:hypothetical protein KP509_20G024000 [Ceratopteris richardii]
MARMQLIALLALFSACVLLASGQGVAAVNVTFELDKLVNFGEGFVVAGNVDELGNWDPAQAAFMTVTGDRFWTVTVDLEADTTVEYKPVKIEYDTRDVIQWLSGSNLKYTVPSEGPAYAYFEFPSSVEENLRIKRIV